MVVTIENIEQAKVREQQARNWLTMSFHQNIVPSPADDVKSIEHKINALTSFKEHYLNNIDSDTMNNDELIDYMLFIESITEQIRAYEIIIGRVDVEHLHRIGKRFGQKHQEPIGLVSLK